MKRGLVFSLCAIAMAATASSAMAQANINVSLNLRYTNPANPASGGTWDLVAKTDDVDGIAALVVYLNNAGTPGSTTMGANIGAMAAVGTPPGPPLLTRETTKLEIVYAQDMTFANTVKLVGRGDGAGPNPAAPGEIAVDALRNPTWNGASRIAFGSFGAIRPTFTQVTGGTPAIPRDSDGNTLPTTINGTNPSIDANITTIVRGDSERGLGLEGVNKGLWGGDANRDGTVNSSDLSILLGNFNGTPRTWDQGNFNNTAGGPNTVVNSSDLSIILGNFNKTGVPVSVAAIPEPSSVLLGASGALLALVWRRRSM